MRFRTTRVSSEDEAHAQEAAQPAASSPELRVIDEDDVTRAAVEASVDRDLIADVEQRTVRIDALSLVCTDKLSPHKLSPDDARPISLTADASAA